MSYQYKTQARKEAFQALFSFYSRGECSLKELQTIISNKIACNDMSYKCKQMFYNLVYGVYYSYAFINAMTLSIKSSDNIHMPNKIIILLGIYECKGIGTPVGVVLQEYQEIAEVFASSYAIANLHQILNT